MTAFRIDVVIDPRKAVAGGQRVGRELDKLQQKANKTQILMQRAIAFVGVGFAVKQIVQLGDAFTGLQNRLRVVTDTERELVTVTQELLDVSNRSRSSFESTAELYSRLALATRELNLEGADLIQVTESINKAIILSGASAKEANNGLIQLSQGLASGRLTGDELRSTLEQLPVVADVIAKRLGVTRGELRKLGAEGKITSIEIIKAFQDAEAEISENFAKTVPTVGQSFVVLRNNVVAFIGRLNQGTGALGAFGTAIRFVGTNVELLAKSLAVLAASLVAVKVAPAIQGFLQLSAAIKAGRAVRLGSIAAINMQNAATAASAKLALASAVAELKRTDAIIRQTQVESINNAVKLRGNALVFEKTVLNRTLIGIEAQRTSQLAALTAAQTASNVATATASTQVTSLSIASAKARAGVKALTAAIAANPIGIFVVALAAVVSALVIFRNEISLTKDGLGTLGDLFTVFFDQLGTALGIIPELFGRAFGGAFAEVAQFIQAFEFEFADLIRIPALFVDRTIGLFIGLGSAIVSILGDLPAAIGDVFIRMVNSVIDALEFIPDVVIGIVKTVGGVMNTFIRGLITSFGLLGSALEQSLAGNFSAARDLAEDAGKAVSSAFDTATDNIGGKLVNNIANELESDLIPRLNPVFEDGFAELGLNALNAFADNADFSGVRDFAEGLIAGANQIASDRTATDAVEAKTQADRQAAIAASERAASIQKLLGPLEREAKLLDIATAAGTREAAIAAQLLSIQDKLTESGIQLTEAQKQFTIELVRSNAAKTENLALSQSLITVEEQLAERTRIANQAFADGAITAAQYSTELRNIDLAAAEASKTIGSGLVTGFAKAQESVSDLASVTENVLTNAFSSAENALVEFATAGKTSFKDFAASIIKDILKVIAKLLIMKAIQGIGGAFGGVAGGGGFTDALAGFGAAPTDQAANGSPNAMANKPFLVGEEGPEIFTPGQTGSISPTDQTIAALTGGAASKKETVVVQAPAPEVNVQTVVVKDPKEIPAAMESPDGRQSIRNVIREERQGIKRDLA